jgi:hypothetical protein
MPSYPVQTGNWSATECHPLPDGGMRCEPVVSEWQKGFAVIALIILGLMLLWLTWESFQTWKQEQKLKAMFKRWRMRSTNPNDQ